MQETNKVFKEMLRKTGPTAEMMRAAMALSKEEEMELKKAAHSKALLREKQRK